jgi:hypothetical protein
MSCHVMSKPCRVGHIIVTKNSVAARLPDSECILEQMSFSVVRIIVCDTVRTYPLTQVSLSQSEE